MWRSSRPVAWAMLTVGAVSIAAALQAQEMPPYSGKGTIDEVRPGFIKMTDSAATDYVVKVADAAKITVVGTAEPDFLTQGLIVRFTAELNKQGLAQAELTEISIVELSDVIGLTLQPDLAPGEDIKSKKGPVNYLVIGHVKSFKNGQLQVAAPGKVIKAKLAEGAKINVDVTNYGWALKGDAITVDGTLFMAGQVIGNKIQIEMAKPLAGKVKRRPPAKSKKSKTPPEEAPLTEEKPKT